MLQKHMAENDKKLFMNRVIGPFVLLAVLSFAHCREDVPLRYDQADGIYFNTPSTTTVTPAVGYDSMFYTFAKYPSRLVDTLKIPVIVLGSATGGERSITVQAVASPEVTAIEGTHFKLMAPYKMPANSYTAVLPIVVYKTPDLENSTVTFIVKLVANADFKLGLTSKTTMKIRMGYLQKPPSWGEFGGNQWAGNAVNMGTWTKTKYKMILSALYDPVSDTTVSEFPYSRASAPAVSLQYLQLVRNYLRNNYPGNFSTPLGMGATLRDQDAGNAVILVGPANY